LDWNKLEKLYFQRKVTQKDAGQRLTKLSITPDRKVLKS
jgi:hypothetical protein